MRNGPALVSGRSHVALARAIGAALGRSVEPCAIEHFPDGELSVNVDERMRGRDIYLVQPTLPPVGENILELALVADALHRVGAARITAVVPYLGFARQERRKRAGEPLGARVAADLLSCGHFARLVAIDLHAASVEGFFAMPIEHLSAVSLLAEAVSKHVRADSVIVSPDLGGAKLARAYAAKLDLPVTIVHKTRVSGRSVEVEDVVGDVKGKSCIIVDDLVSTGGTIEAAVSALRARGANDEVTVAATHALLAGDALDVLSRARITRLVATDTVPPREGGRFERTTVSMAPVIADAIRRLAADWAAAERGTGPESR
jgi:ribose-phosphate pyrophosphokinase